MSYTYDIVGNRTGSIDTRLDSSAAVLAYGGQPNQLTQRDQAVRGGDTTHSYQYDHNGSLRRRKLIYTDSLHPSGRPLWDEHERYSYRGLFTWSHRTDSLNNTLNNNTSDAEDAANNEHRFGKLSVKIEGYLNPQRWRGTAHNGPIDAVRHAYWSSLNAKSFGATAARLIGELHEMGEGGKESEMDINNNEVGIAIALAHPDASDGDLYKLVKAALVSGQLQICPNCPKNSQGMSISNSEAK